MTDTTPPLRRALIAGDQMVEVLDLGNYLELNGWGVVHTASDADAATHLMDGMGEGYGLVIVALRHDHPGSDTLSQMARARDIPLIVINGEERAGAGQVALVSRPFSDAALDAAFARVLGRSA